MSSTNPVIAPSPSPSTPSTPSTPCAASSSSSSSSTAYMEKQIVSTMKRNGYFHAAKICHTLQGTIWSSTKFYPEEKSEQKVVVKVCNKQLRDMGYAVIKGHRYRVQEDIFEERRLLESLSIASNDTYQGIVKYIDWFEDEANYYLVMEHGGQSLFDFVCKVHGFIQTDKIDISEWHRMIKLLFKQLMNAIDFMHKHSMANFDISLENCLINEVDVYMRPDGTLSFVTDDEQHPILLKICDLGLAEQFDLDTNPNWNSCKNAGKQSYKSPEMLAVGTADNENKTNVNAAANDMWCLGVTLFMMVIGGSPFQSATPKDPYFDMIIRGEMSHLLSIWKRTQYVDQELLDLMQSLLKHEKQRITMNQLKNHPWLQ